jgi:hypothetical protein
MSKFRPLIPFLFAAVTLAACSSQPSQQTRAEMEAESARAFNQMRASMPLVTDRETIDFVACVAQSVVEVLEPPFNDIEWELAIFEEGAVNAFAMPGGKIGVFSGLLKVTENQDQLATVIGHEIAHVTAQHSRWAAAIPVRPTRRSRRWLPGRHSVFPCRTSAARNPRLTSSGWSTWREPGSTRASQCLCGSAWTQAPTRSRPSSCRLTPRAKRVSKT